MYIPQRTKRHNEIHGASTRVSGRSVSFSFLFFVCLFVCLFVSTRKSSACVFVLLVCLFVCWFPRSAKPTAPRRRWWAGLGATRRPMAFQNDSTDPLPPRAHFHRKHTHTHTHTHTKPTPVQQRAVAVPVSQFRNGGQVLKASEVKEKKQAKKNESIFGHE